LLAAARAEALWELAAERREIRPDLDLRRLRASVAACDSAKWRSPTHFCSDLDNNDNAVPRVSAAELLDAGWEDGDDEIGRAAGLAARISAEDAPE
jgi:hypothetical protein